MKSFITKIKSAILDDIIWILRNLNKILEITIPLTLLCTLIGCGTTKTATKIVERVKQDTIYLSNVQYDSIFIQNDHSQEYHPYIVTTTDTDVTTLLRTDTIRIRDVSVLYKYKLLRDTVYKSKVDSIPVIKEVTVTKEVKYTPWYAKILSWIGVIALLLLILYITSRVVKFYLKK